MRLLSTTLVIVMAAAAGNNEALADCTSFGGEAVAALIEPAIVKIQTIGIGDCTGNGTGFLIAADGLVITANTSSLRSAMVKSSRARSRVMPRLTK